MSIARRLFSLILTGALLGAVLGVAVPPSALTAAKTCTCDDGGPGTFECSNDQKACEAGSEACYLTCK